MKDTIIPQKIDHIRLNLIISERYLENITHAMYNTNRKILEYYDPFFQHWHMEEGWNSNMEETFDPSWVSVLDESIW